MAQFEIRHKEGMHWVEVTLANETVRAESGALCLMSDGVVMDARLPTPLHWLRARLSDEAVIRPSFAGTGVVNLESSLGGFHVLDLQDETWILERGSYWASDGSIKLGVHRESMITSFWAGEGFIDYRTRVSGTGKVVIHTPGPVQEISLAGQRLGAEGKYVLARTPDVRYRIRRATRSFLGRFLAGEGWVRHYEGTGKVLVCTTPHWRFSLVARRRAKNLAGCKIEQLEETV
jgi:uncharacterized protein (AIM24 family)